MKHISNFIKINGLPKVFEILEKGKNARFSFYFLLCALIVIAALFSPVVLALIER